MATTEEARTKRIEEALKALPKVHETWRVPWRGQQTPLPIIRIEIASTVLNPRSHRIKAQLESDATASDVIKANPDSDDSQEAIRKLLRETPGFEPLKQNLSDEGQKEPGIVTHNGRLINANTRAVAMGDLDIEYIEVVVLPPDATLGEIYDLELNLQVAQDYKQDYSFTNEILFVEDLITEQHRDEKQVAIQLRWAAPTKATSVKSGIEKVQRYVRHLDLIRDIQKLSGGKIPLTDFDDAEQALFELDTSYEGLRYKDQIAAHRLKQARILGLLVDLGYERQRQVDADWVETYLSEALSEQEDLRDIVEAIAAAPTATNSYDQGDIDSDPLADFEDLNEGDAGVASDAHAVVETLVQALGSSARELTITLPTENGDMEFDRGVITAAINDAMRAAAEDAKNAAKAGSDLKLPAHLLEDAAKKLTRARTAYDKVCSNPSFNNAGLQDRIGKVERALDALKIATQAK